MSSSSAHKQLVAGAGAAGRARIDFVKSSSGTSGKGEAKKEVRHPRRRGGSQTWDRLLTSVPPPPTPSPRNIARCALAPQGLVLPPLSAHIARFDVEPLLAWSRPRGPSRGLVNQGNTCYMNATLQCIAATPALAQLLARCGHASSCRAPQGEFCVYCVVERIVGTLMYKGIEIGGARPGALNPSVLSSSIRALGRQFRVGRQEDSHEFLRCLLERMHARSLRNAGVSEGAPDRQAETTDIHRLCGGYFRNQLHCPLCGFDANSYEPFLDLSLEVGGSLNSLERALRAFCTVERLDERNKWTCPSCSKPVCAEKRLTLARSPPVLTVHFKRFSFTSLSASDKNRSLLAVRAAMGGCALPFGRGSGGNSKIGSHIAFPLLLDLAPHISEPAPTGMPLLYDLHGVLVHQGASSNSGHYFSFVKDAAGAWAKMNDEIVSRTSESDVLKQPAYMLFYSRRPSHAAPVAVPAELLSSKGEAAATVHASASEQAPERVTDFEGLAWSGPERPAASKSLTIPAALTRAVVSESLYGGGLGAVGLVSQSSESAAVRGLINFKLLGKRKRLSPHTHFAVNSGHQILFDPFRLNSLIPHPRVWDRQAVRLRCVKAQHTIFPDEDESTEILTKQMHEFAAREHSLAAFVASSAPPFGAIGDDSDDASDADDDQNNSALRSTTFTDAMRSAGAGSSAAANHLLPPARPTSAPRVGGQLERVIITGQNRRGGTFEAGALAISRPPLMAVAAAGGGALGQRGWDDDDDKADAQWEKAIATWTVPAPSADDEDARIDAGRTKKVKVEVLDTYQSNSERFQSKQQSKQRR